MDKHDSGCCRAVRSDGYRMCDHGVFVPSSSSSQAIKPVVSDKATTCPYCATITAAPCSCRQSETDWQAYINLNVHSSPITTHPRVRMCQLVSRGCTSSTLPGMRSMVPAAARSSSSHGRRLVGQRICSCDSRLSDICITTLASAHFTLVRAPVSKGWSPAPENWQKAA